MDETCTYAKQFVDHYYEKLDKSRSTLEKLYHESANLVWNGNPVNGREKILEFFSKNLPISETNLSTLDAQPVSYIENVEGKRMIFISCVGSIKFSNQHPKTFTQNFVLIAESDTDKIYWKIVSDTFRLL